jgi:hypothetical protein
MYQKGFAKWGDGWMAVGKSRVKFQLPTFLLQSDPTNRWIHKQSFQRDKGGGPHGQPVEAYFGS